MGLGFAAWVKAFKFTRLRLLSSVGLFGSVCLG